MRGSQAPLLSRQRQALRLPLGHPGAVDPVAAVLPGGPEGGLGVVVLVDLGVVVVDLPLQPQGVEPVV